MNKPQSLRHALNKSVPYVRENPDRLHLFVDNGSLVATSARVHLMGVPLHPERGGDGLHRRPELVNGPHSVLAAGQSARCVAEPL